MNDETLFISLLELKLHSEQIRGLSFTNKNVGVAGTTAVGVVTGVANGESDFAVNDSVLVVGNGLWADEATVSKTNVSKLSKATSEDSATLPTLLSAWGILNNSVKLSQGDVVLQSSGDSATGAAISQIGKALGYTVISPSSAELADPKFVANTKAAHKSVKLAVTDRSGKIALDLARTVSNNGSMVFYNGHIESVEQSVGVDIPAASTIYKGVSIVGFDLGAWHAADRAGFEKGVAAVQALSSDKKVSVKSKVFPVADFKKAVADVEATNSAAVIKF